MEYRDIQLNNGLTTRVSAHRFDELNAFKWSALRNPTSRKFYVARNVPRGKGQWFLVYMHREVLGLMRGDPRQADHCNMDTLDNTDENLRVATCGENQRNRSARKDNVVGLKGVSSNGTRWRARIRAGGDQIHLGTRRTKEEAYALYCEAARNLHKEFARG